jgi:molybdenum cofactor cytidylyltransferase
MQFGTFPLDDCDGAILAHSQVVGDRRLKKGTVLDAEAIRALRDAGHTVATVARLDSGDLHEDTAAMRVAEACCGEGLYAGTAATGRVNLFAAADGLIVYDRARLDALNAVDEAITVAAVEPYARVQAGQIAATIKIIPFGVAADRVREAGAAARAGDGAPLLRGMPFTPKDVGLVQTRLPGTADKVLAKTERTVRERLDGLGSTLTESRVVGHTRDAVADALTALAGAGRDIALIVGASATTDRRDTIPAAIDAAGGTVEHFGMPVDPGNLLVMGRFGGMRVLALPGSARSPRTGGNDWVLWRLCADLDVTPEAIQAMGGGGLLKDIAARPLPRREAAPAEAKPARAPWHIGAVVLAAGQSRRMGGANKLLTEIDGEPILRRTLRTAVRSRAEPVVVVTGHGAARVQAAIGDFDVQVAHNAAHAQGMAASIRAGVAALPDGLDGAILMLGDMPAIRPDTVDALIAAFDPPGGTTICVPEHEGTQGHPVLFARRFFGDLRDLHGDVGAKAILREHPDQIATVAVADDGITVDLDTPEAVAAYARRSGGAGA